MIAQGVTIPTHIGSVPSAMATLFKTFGDDIHEGDVFVMNDPFDGGMHIPDIFIVKPIFVKGERWRLRSPPPTISIWAAGCRAVRPATIRKFSRTASGYHG